MWDVCNPHFVFICRVTPPQQLGGFWFLAHSTIGLPLARCVVCRLSVVCDVLYCGETVRPSKKV